MFYMLTDQREIIQTDDIRTWGEWMQNENRSVARTDIRRPPGKRVYVVSTVFLGIDHGTHFSEWGQIFQPVLFETMIYFVDQVYRAKYGSWLDFQIRYRTYAEAEWGHWDAVRRFGAGQLILED